MIYQFKTPAEADSVPGPKHVWIDGNRTVVFTDTDIPPIPFAVEAIYTESEIISVLESVGKTKAESKEILSKLRK